MSSAADGRMKVLELHCGIGGCAAALGEAAVVTGAVDINDKALEVYRANFGHSTWVRSVESLSSADLARFDADLWWTSPPCQPYTRRGHQRDDEDPRAQGLLALLDRLAEVRPRYLALENVPGFAASRSHARLLATLSAASYRWQEAELCPTELGVPNRRRRYYLLASREPLPAFDGGGPTPLRPLADFLDPPADDDPHLAVDPQLRRRYDGALHVVDARDPGAVTTCFTAAYGRSPVRSGSYLRLPDGGLRRFHPREVLRLLSFPEDFRLPPQLPARRGWKLAGNSLALAAVRRVLGSIPELNAALGSSVPLGSPHP